ncbi:MAG: hypothetical protein KAR35_09360 [Candidatus Heimdallarchaeota archaeon]|nr:hypothetical protein [Candidatus Heimdallarchaeota archaeon]MCK5049563.1 hypothetical protein [Candidatus Heimdallarchaeota archaeon]
MLESKGEFLSTIQDFLSSLYELTEILKSYNVTSITELKRKIDEKELPEHPSYEDYLDCLSLFGMLSETKLKLFDDLNGVDLESFR